MGGFQRSLGLFEKVTVDHRHIESFEEVPADL